MKRFICGLFATIGLLCVLFSGPITTVLPYILGGTMTPVYFTSVILLIIVSSIATPIILKLLYAKDDKKIGMA